MSEKTVCNTKKPIDDFLNLEKNIFNKFVKFDGLFFHPNRLYFLKIFLFIHFDLEVQKRTL